jgi:hypothetical protein
MTNCDSRKVEIFNFRDDFQILPLKEKRGILKNAKSFLQLQKKNILLFENTLIPYKEKKT